MSVREKISKKKEEIIKCSKEHLWEKINQRYFVSIFVPPFSRDEKLAKTYL